MMGMATELEECRWSSEDVAEEELPRRRRCASGWWTRECAFDHEFCDVQVQRPSSSQLPRRIGKFRQTITAVEISEKSIVIIT